MVTEKKEIEATTLFEEARKLAKQCEEDFARINAEEHEIKDETVRELLAFLKGYTHGRFATIARKLTEEQE